MTMSLSPLSGAPRFGVMSPLQKGVAALGVAGAALLGSQALIPSNAATTTPAPAAARATVPAKEEDDIKLASNLQSQFLGQKTAEQKFKLLMKAMNALNADGWSLHGNWILDTMDPESKTQVDYTDAQKSALIVRLTASANANAYQSVPFYRMQQINARSGDAQLKDSTRRFLALGELYRDYQRNKDERQFSVDHLDEYYKLQNELTK